MRLREARHGQIQVFHLQGEVDLNYVPVLRSLFSAKSHRHCAALVVDLSGVTFIGSSGIAVLLEYLRDAQAYQGAFCMTGPNERVRSIFKTAGLDPVMPIFPTLADAVAAWSDGSVAAAPTESFAEAAQPAPFPATWTH